MQRRAAAVYFGLFVLIAAGAFGFMQTGMSEPPVELDGPTYTQTDELRVDDRSYTVDDITTATDEDGAGPAGSLTWFNDSKRESATIENGSTVTVSDVDYQVAIPNESDPGSFELIEQPNVSAVLANDPAVEDETATQGDQEFVFYTNGSRVPLSTYLGPLETREIGVDDEFAFDAENVTARVDAITPSEVRISWPTPGEETIELSEGGNVTLNGHTYFAHFTEDGAVQILPSDEYYSTYAEQRQDIDYWEERRNGVWGIVILSVLGAILLLSLAYLPVKG